MDYQPPAKKMRRFLIENLLAPNEGQQHEYSENIEENANRNAQWGWGQSAGTIKEEEEQKEYDIRKYVRPIFENGNDVEFNEKFKMQKWRGSFVIEDLPADPEELLRRLFQKCIDDAVEEAERNGISPDHLGLSISSVLLDPDIWIPVRPLSENTADAALNRFAIVAQSKSNEGNLYGEPFSITVTTIDKRELAKSLKSPAQTTKSSLKGSGGGQKIPHPINHRISIQNLIPVHNAGLDTHCLFHALYLTYSHKMKLMDRRNFYKLVHLRHKYRVTEVENMMREAKIRRGLTEYDARLYVPMIVDRWNAAAAAAQGDQQEQQQLQQYRFKVFIFEKCGNFKPAYMYGAEDFNIPIVLYHDSAHFWGVRSVGGLFDKNNYCLSCLSPYQDARLHRKDCKRLCLCCGRMGFRCAFVNNCLDYQNFCSGCSKHFVNEECFEAHKANRFCEMSKKCLMCGVTWDVEVNTRNGREGHKCDEKYCAQCDCFHTKERGCFIQPLKPHKELPVYRCVAYDFETVQDRVVDAQKQKKLHEVNFAAAIVFCTRCIEQNRWKSSLLGEAPCEICGPHRTITFSHRPFSGTQVDKQNVTDNPLGDFVKWIMEGLPLKYTTMAFAHYGGRFDTIMVFKEIFQRNSDCSLIRRGNKLFQLKVNGRAGINPQIFFRDSFNLFPIALGKLVGAFGLQGIADKPFFPYLANSKKYYDRTYPCLPPKDMYCFKGFMPAKKEQFERWYAKNRARDFCLNNELAAYCVNDVQILMASLIAFRAEFLDITAGERDDNGVSAHLGIDPLRDGITISSNCLRNFRLNHLPSDQHLGIVPEQGYDASDSQSTLALKFFKWYAEKHRVQIRTSHSGGEQIIGKYKLDGYYVNNKEESIGMEVHGCVFHAHKCRFPDDDQLIKPVGKTAGWIRKRDAVREEYLREHLTRLDIFYECEINAMLKQDREMKEAFADYMDEGPIQLREQGFYGGRTGPFKVFKQVEEGEEIGYLDFRSLYPYTNFVTPYPIKHPKVGKFTGQRQNVEWTKPEDCKYRGFVKAFVVPPRKPCKIPPLPVKFDDRLLFPLCRACALRYPEGGWSAAYSCTHGDKKRGWVSTASTLELKEALKDGFRVTKLFRVLHYPDDQWDDALFKKYVSTFNTIKTHASGFPPDVNTPEKEAKFIRECAELFGMLIEKGKMCKNEARRTLAKLCLNSLWGRFSLRNNLTKTQITNSIEEICKFLGNPSIQIASIDELSAETLMITYETKKEFIVENEGSNVVISAWTTSAARVRLLQAMRLIANCPGAELLYTDTDSCIYSYRKGQNPLQTGDHLGDLASEVPPGYEIVEFVCGGAKQYGLKMRKIGTADQFEYVLKLRGITLDHRASRRLNYETFKAQVLAFARGEHVVPIGVTNPQFFRPNIRTGTVTTGPMTKLYKPVLSGNFGT